MFSRSSSTVRFGLVALAATVAVATSASAQHQDALVFQDGGKVQMGGIDVDCLGGVGVPGCDPNGTTETVYEAELLENGVSPGLFGTADEPGFFSVGDGDVGALPYGDNLPASADHSIDLILAPNSPVPGASVLFWDGTGAVSWSPMPNSEYFDIGGILGTGGILDGSNELLGVSLDPTGLDGAFDTHPDFFLYGDGGTADPTFGFYAIFGRTNISGLASSDPWAAVFDFGVENEVLHEAAVDSVAGILPEPSTATLLVIGLAGLLRSGRQRTVA